ncbi:Uncharacterised protein [Klebsiella pneumoniae]|nr:Uncharacterised protein [Klebsiella pneumoniae]
MRNVQNDAALFAQLADHAKEIFYFTRRERAGWLIEGDNFGVTRQRFGNFHHLPLADGEILKGRLRIDIQPKVLELQARFIIEQRAVDHAAFMRKLAQIDVLRHGHFRNEMQLLIDDGDARI